MNLKDKIVFNYQIRIKMECPECGSEMIENGAYGYLAQHQSGDLLTGYPC